VFSYQNNIETIVKQYLFTRTSMKKKITPRPETPAYPPNHQLPIGDEKQVEAFVNNAPDAPVKPEKKGVIRGKREQISLTMPPESLVRVDAVAQAQGLTRAGLINLAIAEYLRRYEG